MAQEAPKTAQGAPKMAKRPLRQPKGHQRRPKKTMTVQEGVPGASPTSALARGWLEDSSGIEIFPPRAPRWGIKGVVY